MFILVSAVLFLSMASARLSLHKSSQRSQQDIDEEHMRNLIGLANATNPAAPFGAAIVDRRNNSIVCTGVNSDGPLTAPFLHGEIVAINNCSNMYGWNKTLARNYTLYTTAESCPMCQSGSFRPSSTNCDVDSIHTHYVFNCACENVQFCSV